MYINLYVDMLNTIDMRQNAFTAITNVNTENKI